jgi:beta-galactosidase
MNTLPHQQNFDLGCNYWTSTTGTNMWHDWQPDIIQSDLKKIAAIALNCVRIFPLWTDFQPLAMLYGIKNRPYEIGWTDDRAIIADQDGMLSGVDPLMLDRLKFVCDCAKQNGLQVSIGLVTGWMSGRLYAPQAFAGRNLLTDPLVIRWQINLVRRIVRDFAAHPALKFWGVGNECNCMSEADRNQGWAWMNQIASAIRLEDTHHPVVAGLHGIIPESPVMAAASAWTIQDMGSVCDILTTHPYPAFTPHAAIDRITGFKNVFHAAAESRFYSDIGGKNCIAEEMGTLAPVFAGEQEAADYLKNALYNLWCHNSNGMFWWCAFDQTKLRHPPYQWYSLERELGIFKTNGTKKKIADIMKNFAGFLKKLPFAELPDFKKDAICVLTEDQDAWKVAWGTWLLAKQANFDIEFQYAAEPLKPAQLYLVPCLSGLLGIKKDFWLDLIQRAKAGATVYISLADALLAEFEEIFGIEALYREEQQAKFNFTFADSTLEMSTATRFYFKPVTAVVLAEDEQHNPVMCSAKLGKGEIIFLAAPLENNYIETSKSWQRDYYKIYQKVAQKIRRKRIIQSVAAPITVTEHHFDNGRILLCLVNNSGDDILPALKLHQHYSIISSEYGDISKVGAHSIILLWAKKLQKQNSK